MKAAVILALLALSACDAPAPTQTAALVTTPGAGGHYREDAEKPDRGFQRILAANAELARQRADAEQVATVQSNAIRVPLLSNAGVHYVKLSIAGVCCFLFVIDSGSADVTVSPTLFKAMIKGGYVGKDELIDVQSYRTASGAIIEGVRFRMPPMTIEGLTVRNVTGSVSEGTEDTAMLLGQSFLQKFRYWAIDNRASQLVLGY